MNLAKRILGAAIVVVSLFSFASQTVASPVGIANINPRPLGGAPMQIESCIVSPTLSSPVQNVASIGVGYLAGKLGGIASLGVALGGGAAVAFAARKSTLTVQLSNEGSVPITAMRVEADSSGAPVFERENLTIAPGDIVTRKYAGAGFYQNDQPQAVNCRVDWVQFADGTTWSTSSYQQAR